MFRKMRRHAQQLPAEECLEILKTVPRGVLSLLGDEGYPYGVPLDFWYCSEDGRLYFHGAREGHKLDAIARCDKVSFCVLDEGVRREGEWALHFRSVVVFGRVSLVEDAELTRRICRSIAERFTDDERYIENELTGALPRVQCLALTPEHITGKRVTES